MTGYRVLNEVEIAQSLKGLPGWFFSNPNIAVTFEFASFRVAMCFIAGVGLIAEKLNHHPEFSSSYNKVSFSFCTHDVGFKVTDVDISTAKELTELAMHFGAHAV